MRFSYKFRTVSDDVIIAALEDKLGEAAAHREQEKISKYRGNAAAEAYLFYPLVFESHGFTNEETQKLIKKLARRIADQTNANCSLTNHYWSFRICTTLQRGNANIIQGQEERMQSLTPPALDEDERAQLYETHQQVLFTVSNRVQWV
jgi:hypothetical protein